MYRSGLISAILLLCCSLGNCQDETPTAVTPQNRTGDLPYSASLGTDIEHIDLVSGNLMINVPIVDRPGRGLGFHFGLRYDSRFIVIATRL